MKITRKDNQSKNKDPRVGDSDNFTMKFIPYQPDGFLNKLAYMLIRPPKFVYNPVLLEPSKKYQGRFSHKVHHVPFQLNIYLPKDTRYVILYLHGNGSSSLQGYMFLSSLPEGVGLACFDFAACGNRVDSQFLTLGQKQSEDVTVAARYIKSLGHKVVGWGRSMGAVSLLLSMQCHTMICDSAFSNLSEVCKENSQDLVPKKISWLVKCLYPCLFQCIKSKVQSLAGLKIQQMDICKHITSSNDDNLDKSICFLHGEQDNLVQSHHSKKLYESFQGNKQLLLFQGTHNGNRQPKVISQCFYFIENALIGTQRSKKEKGIAFQLRHKDSDGYLSTSNSPLKNSKTISNRQTKESLNFCSYQKTNETFKPQNFSDMSDNRQFKLKEQNSIIGTSFIKVSTQSEYLPFPSHNLQTESIKKQELVQKMFYQK